MITEAPPKRKSSQITPPAPGTPATDHGRTPLGHDGTARFDHTLSAVLEHLMQLEDFQMAAHAELLTIKALVEELLP
jgi:hypothetical protein